MHLFYIPFINRRHASGGEAYCYGRMGEVVTYHYNGAGQVESLTSSKLGKQSTIVERIGYDEFGHMVYQKLGNGTETTYGYIRFRLLS